MVRKEDADNEAKPLPPANINHTDTVGGGEGGGVNSVNLNTFIMSRRNSRSPSCPFVWYLMIIFRAGSTSAEEKCSV